MNKTRLRVSTKVGYDGQRPQALDSTSRVRPLRQFAQGRRSLIDNPAYMIPTVVEGSEERSKPLAQVAASKPTSRQASLSPPAASMGPRSNSTATGWNCRTEIPATAGRFRQVQRAHPRPRRRRHRRPDRPRSRRVACGLWARAITDPAATAEAALTREALLRDANRRGEQPPTLSGARLVAIAPRAG